jgi:CBS domain-containing protein
MSAEVPFNAVVRELMTKAPKTVSPELSCAELLDRFAQHDVNAFPVVDPDGALHGIVSKLDLLRLFVARGPRHVPDRKRMEAEPVSGIMRPGTLNVEPEDPAFSAMELMVETRLQSLPVVRRGSGSPKLAGIITRGDLLRALPGVAPASGPAARTRPKR